MNEEYKKSYIEFLRKFIDTKKPLKVVFDASNGPAGLIVQDLFASNSVEAIVINDSVDPDFSAHGPNPLAPLASQMIGTKIKETNADVGVMFDADGDRAIFVNDKGEMMDACFALAFIFGYLDTPVVVDELIFQAIKFLKIFPEKNMIPSRIGAFFIKEKIREHSAFGGGEFSGHFFFKDFFNADSGIFASIFFLNALSRTNDKISKWQESLPPFRMITVEIKTENLDVARILETLKADFKDVAREVGERDGLSLVFEDFWCNVRSSNTEPIMRIIAGGAKNLEEKVEEIKNRVLGIK